MAHYAVLDQNNIVIKVICGKDEEDNPEINWEHYYSDFFQKSCKRTSYNSIGNIHKNPNKFPYRKNYAGIGYFYDENLDAFIPPQPYPSWILDEDTCLWHSPIPIPEDANIEYIWDEPSLTWKKSPQRENI